MEDAVILYDGVCNLCNASVRFIIHRDRKARFRFASLQSAYAARIFEKLKFNSRDADSVVLVENGKIFTRSTAALKIAMRLSGLWPLAGVFFIVPACIRDAVYEGVAKNRYRWFGKKQFCEMPPREFSGRFLD